MFIFQTLHDIVNIRPSPVKFTSQRPDQFPIKPEPERINPQAVADAMKHKMLSLENIKDLPDFGGKEDDDDDEVTKITGGNDGNHQLLTRFINHENSKRVKNWSNVVKNVPNC